MTFQTKDSGARQEFDTGMVRDVQEGKMRPDLIWLPGLIRYAELMARGAEKYGERNWEQASTLEERDRFRASAFRHFIQWFAGERDEDHASAVKFNIDGAEMVESRLANTHRSDEEFLAALAAAEKVPAPEAKLPLVGEELSDKGPGPSKL